MAWGLVCALLAAASTAAATICQATGARRARRYRAVNPRLMISALHSAPYVVGLILLAMSFVLTLIALRTTALFVVQGLTAASIAAVAAASAVIFRVRLRLREWSAVAAVCGGVTMLVVAQRPSVSVTVPAIGSWAVFAAAVAIGVVALTARHWLDGAALPGLLAGLAFGDAAVASRVIAQLDGSPYVLLADPATYAIVVSGLIGTLLYTAALQRGAVTAVFGLNTVAQTVGPALVGWLVLGDSVRAGTVPVAGAGFMLALLGALLLGRHACPDRSEPDLGTASTAGTHALPALEGSPRTLRLIPVMTMGLLLAARIVMATARRYPYRHSEAAG